MTSFSSLILWPHLEIIQNLIPFKFQVGVDLDFLDLSQLQQIWFQIQSLKGPAFQFQFGNDCTNSLQDWSLQTDILLPQLQTQTKPGADLNLCTSYSAQSYS